MEGGAFRKCTGLTAICLPSNHALASYSHIITQNGAQHLNSRRVLLPAPLAPDAVEVGVVVMQASQLIGQISFTGGQPKHVRLWYGAAGPNQNTSRIQIL